MSTEWCLALMWAVSQPAVGKGGHEGGGDLPPGEQSGQGTQPA